MVAWRVTVVLGSARMLEVSTSDNSTEHHACCCDPGCGEVVVGETHKTCRNKLLLKVGSRWQERQRVRSLGGDAACFPDICHNDDCRVLVRLPCGFVSAVEDGKSHCRIEMYGVAPIVSHTSKNDRGLPHVHPG